MAGAVHDLEKKIILPMINSFLHSQTGFYREQSQLLFLVCSASQVRWESPGRICTQVLCSYLDYLSCSYLGYVIVCPE